MPESSDQPYETTYYIYIKGRVNENNAEWFEECQITDGEEGSVFSINIVDQPRCMDYWQRSGIWDWNY